MHNYLTEYATIMQHAGSSLVRNPKRVLTWLALVEDYLASLKSVVVHAACQVKELAIAQAEEDGHLAQRLKAPHILDGAQQAVKGLALKGKADHCRLGCHSRCPAAKILCDCHNKRFKPPMSMKNKGRVSSTKEQGQAFLPMPSSFCHLHHKHAKPMKLSNYHGMIHGTYI